MMKTFKRLCVLFLPALCAVAVLFFVLTFISILPLNKPLKNIPGEIQTARITDRNGIPLNISYQNQWNSFDLIPLYDMPELLKDAFIISEDKRFFEHNGIDWSARASALLQNIRSLRNVRGASTITEQTVRMIRPRPRSLWSRWIEGFEAIALENSESKSDILEFYLNQIPYASGRRGIAQAARFYFNRDIKTISPKEMLALVVLVRAPSGYDLYKQPDKIENKILILAKTLKDTGKLSEQDYQSIKLQKTITTPPILPVEARHFARYIRQFAPPPQDHHYRTTLNSALQSEVQNILDQRLKNLKSKNVNNAGALVADYTTGEILAWIIGGASDKKSTPSFEIDTVTTPRQPGSSMKPFLYAAALDKGWNAASIIDDSPLAESVGSGLHNFKNYSNTFYGKITLREALGNSLNIPALRTIRYVGTGDYLTILQKLNFKSLNKNSQIYDEGLALGNGEVTLLEMVQAYATLANKGMFSPLKILIRQNSPISAQAIYTPETASLIGNILSDPTARSLEFGAGSALNLPHQTAVKTGTSTDYRDAWIFGYDDRHVVGIWMGNLNADPMNEVTGSSGPSAVLRAVFASLNKNRETRKLYISPKLFPHDICIRPPEADGTCTKRTEWFSILPENNNFLNQESNTKTILPELIRPTEGLQIAYDPRIHEDHQKFRFEINHNKKIKKISWILNDKLLEETEKSYLLWKVKRGKHRLSVIITNNDKTTTELPHVNFQVK